MSDVLSAGFLPLTDAAPLVVAREMGFAAEEGLDLQLVKAPSWSSLRDYLVLGKLEAAQMLAPVPVAGALGLGALGGGMEVIAALNLSGNTTTISNALAAQMREAGYDFDFTDATAAGKALIALGRPLRIAVPFPFSMHAELLYYWLEKLGLAAPQSLSVRTIPPPLMAQAMASGEVDAICVGEPWGSLAVENGDGVMLLPTSAIRQSAIEKVLAVRDGWADENPDLTRKLLRALWRASIWLDQPDKREVAAEIMARPDYLGLPVDLVERALRGVFIISPQGDLRDAQDFLVFASGAAGFPWRSQAAWIGMRIAARTGLDQAEAMKAAKAVFRTDIYRNHLRDVGVDLPSASEKVEGGLDHVTEVASETGRVILAPDRFFDGTVFDPE